MNHKYIFALCLVMLPTSSLAGWFGTGDYDECILKSMKGVTSDVAATSIRRSCRKKFPKEKVDTKPLSYSDLSQLTGRANLSFGNYYSGNIYNGNKEITIAEISIQVTTESGGEKITRTYTDDVNIPPQSTADFGVSIVTGDEGAKYSWNIIGAKGY